MTIKGSLQGLSILAIIAIIPPFFWHIKTKNIQALTLLTWLFLYNLKIFVDATVWSKDIIDLMTGWDGKGWCDVMIYIEIGSYVAVPCCVCRLAYELTTIIKAENILPDKSKISYVFKELFICNALSFLCMLMSYFIQINRYGLTTYNGCQPFLSTTWVTILLYSIWPFIVSTLGTFFSFRLLYIFYKKRRDAKDILHCTDSGLTLSRFSRFIFFCMLIILIMFPVSIYNFINTCTKVKGRYSYHRYHENGAWWEIPKIGTDRAFYSVWIYMAMAYCSFFIFGTSQDALTMYLDLLKKLGLRNFIERKQEKRQEKKQAKYNQMLHSAYYNNDGEDSFLGKAETPVAVNGSGSSWTENTKFKVYEDVDFEYLNTAGNTPTGDVGKEFENFEINYREVDNSNKIKFDASQPNSSLFGKFTKGKHKNIQFENKQSIKDTDEDNFLYHYEFSKN
ncbi:uncharacterized protein HGUI_03964 [Hanseniaspora guilliermondii]|uniref:Pheromone a factor receptor n=1 Tax=Hanseniaspora guilliermondii TaxID=56406 RepID=A0A1L0B9D7_9ASCO|nr:uncharacterized protein HGUI_03964 [Hanseniaspora guilliermondii]